MTRNRYLTETELAEWLRLSPRTLETWRRRRQGPRFFRLVGTVRYSEVDVEEWLAQQERLPEEGSDQ